MWKSVFCEYESIISTQSVKQLESTFENIPSLTYNQDMNSYRPRRLHGFTLIELLIVIAIISLLAIMVIISLVNVRLRAKNAAAKTNVSEAGKAIEAYRIGNSSDNVIAAVSNPSTVTVPDGTNPVANEIWNCTVSFGGTTPIRCNVSSLDSNGTSIGSFSSLFSGKEQFSTSTANSYGINFSKTPNIGMYYYYMTQDLGTVPAGTLSASPHYAFVVDLGVQGVSNNLDSSRYYFVLDGTSQSSNSTSQATHTTIKLQQ